MRKSDDPVTSSSDEHNRPKTSQSILLIRKIVRGVPNPGLSSYSGNTFHAFQVTITKEVEDLIATALNKHCLLDPVPTSLVKELCIVTAICI